MTGIIIINIICPSLSGRQAVRILKYHIVIISIMISCVLLTGCIKSKDTREGINLEQRLAELGFSNIETIHSISMLQLHGWQYVDEQHLIIHFSPTTYYLLGFQNNCQELRYADAITFSTAIGNIMTGDRVIAERFPGIKLVCWIDSLYKLDRNHDENKN